jgi:hypothetical protein
MPLKKSISPQAVTTWLEEHHPELQFEQDRSWLWVIADLRKEPAVRESLKAFGFIFAKRGGHKLPSGQLGTWGHSCDTPLPFYRKGNKSKSVRVEVPAADDSTMKELLEFASGII